MKKNLLVVAILAVTLVFVSEAPAQRIFGAWQWPTSHLPVLDGDISEWEVIPEEVWIDIFDPDFVVAEGDVGREVDTSVLWFRFAASYNTEVNRIYYVLDRYDNIWDRSGGGYGCCGQDDSIEIGIDADHSGGWYYFGADSGMTEEELHRNRGRHAQTYHYRWPPLEPFGWSWKWQSPSTWHDQEPYACCADSYTLIGSHGTEATFQAEWYQVGFNDFNWQDPEGSVIHQFEEGQIIGLAISVVDNDLGTEDNWQTKTAKWVLGGATDIWGNTDSFPNFILLPVMWEYLPTAVEDNSWGQIKASFAQ